MHDRTLAGVILALLTLLNAAPIPAQKKVSLPQKAAQDLLGDNWIVEAEAPPGLDRFLPAVHPFLARLRARGGFPYEKLLLSGKGKVLARSRIRELLDRAEAKEWSVRFREGKPVLEGTPAGDGGLRDAMQVLGKAARSKDPGSALTLSLLFLEVLTVKGEFVSAAVKKIEGKGLAVEVDWKQGTRFWGYTEQARWTVRFNARGAFTDLEKVQTRFERERRR